MASKDGFFGLELRVMFDRFGVSTPVPI